MEAQSKQTHFNNSPDPSPSRLLESGYNCTIEEEKEEGINDTKEDEDEVGLVEIEDESAWQEEVHQVDGLGDLDGSSHSCSGSGSSDGDTLQTSPGGKHRADLEALLAGAAEEQVRLQAARDASDGLKKLLHDPDGGAAMPLVKAGVSIAADMKMGWKPRVPNAGVSGAPIPLFYEFGQYDAEAPGQKPYSSRKVQTYAGPRISNSLQVHRYFSRKAFDDSKNQAYSFKFPPRPPQIQRKRAEPPRGFTGMNPALPDLMGSSYDPAHELVFDSFFESGNLDMVTRDKGKSGLTEYDLYMRVDTNTRGHHQWFYFSCEHQEFYHNKTVTFNIMNFTKEDSLYGAGMRVVVSRRSDNYRWVKGGEDISYFQSRHMRRRSRDPKKMRYYYQLRFSYKFTAEQDKVFFAYCYPYTYSMLQRFLKEISLMRAAERASQQGSPLDRPRIDYFKESVLCKSLSGADLPLLTITSRLSSDPQEYNLVKMEEFEDADSKVSLPLYKRKKYVIVAGRVHPGESNSSWMMQGFIRYLLGNSLQAKQLRKRLIFKIVPMINVDGVIIGNYRTSMAGNDLNRRYVEPNPRLHPEVCAIKNLINSIAEGKSPDQYRDPFGIPKSRTVSSEEDIMAFVDMHGHSRKKNVFIYGPQFSLSSDKYYRARIIPKLLAEETSKFRYHSCQFKYEHAKRKTARIVLNQEFDIMNCFTFEASFHGHFNDQRENFEFNEATYEEMGEHLVNSFYEYSLIVEEEQRLRQLKEMEKKKRKRAYKPTSVQIENSGAQSANKQTNISQDHQLQQQIQANILKSITQKSSNMGITDEAPTNVATNTSYITATAPAAQQIPNLEGTSDIQGEETAGAPASAVSATKDKDAPRPNVALAGQNDGGYAQVLKKKKTVPKERNSKSMWSREVANTGSDERRGELCSMIQDSTTSNKNASGYQADRTPQCSSMTSPIKASEAEGLKTEARVEPSLEPTVITDNARQQENNTACGRTSGGGGIRNIKALFSQLREEEERREEMAQIEEEELGFVPDQEDAPQDPEVNADDACSDNDSDASDGELAGEERQSLFSDILGTIKAFCQQYDGHTTYDQVAGGRYGGKNKKDGKSTKKKRIGDNNTTAAALNRIKESNRAGNVMPNAAVRASRAVKPVARQNEKPKPQAQSVSPAKQDRSKPSNATPNDSNPANGSLRKTDNLFRHTLLSCMDRGGAHEFREPTQPQPKQQYQRRAAVVPAQQFQYLTYEQNEERGIPTATNNRLDTRKRLAQQGLLNRVGRAQTRTLPQQPFLTTNQPPEGAGVLSPLLVSKIQTKEPPNALGDSAEEEDHQIPNSSSRGLCGALPSSGAQRIPAGGLQRGYMERRNRQAQKLLPNRPRQRMENRPDWQGMLTTLEQENFVSHKIPESSWADSGQLMREYDKINQMVSRKEPSRVSNHKNPSNDYTETRSSIQFDGSKAARAHQLKTLNQIPVQNAHNQSVENPDGRGTKLGIGRAADNRNPYYSDLGVRASESQPDVSIFGAGATVKQGLIPIIDSKEDSKANLFPAHLENRAPQMATKSEQGYLRLADTQIEGPRLQIGVRSRLESEPNLMPDGDLIDPSTNTAIGSRSPANSKQLDQKVRECLNSNNKPQFHSRNQRTDWPKLPPGHQHPPPLVHTVSHHATCKPSKETKANFFQSESREAPFSLKKPAQNSATKLECQTKFKIDNQRMRATNRVQMFDIMRTMDQIREPMEGQARSREEALYAYARNLGSHMAAESRANVLNFQLTHQSSKVGRNETHNAAVVQSESFAKQKRIQQQAERMQLEPNPPTATGRSRGQGLINSKRSQVLRSGARTIGRVSFAQSLLPQATMYSSNFPNLQPSQHRLLLAGDERGPQGRIAVNGELLPQRDPLPPQVYATGKPTRPAHPSLQIRDNYPGTQVLAPKSQVMVPESKRGRSRPQPGEEIPAQLKFRPDLRTKDYRLLPDVHPPANAGARTTVTTSFIGSSMRMTAMPSSTKSAILTKLRDSD